MVGKNMLHLNNLCHAGIEKQISLNRFNIELNFRATKDFDHYRLLSDLRLGILGCGDIGGESKYFYKFTLGQIQSAHFSSQRPGFGGIYPCRCPFQI